MTAELGRSSMSIAAFLAALFVLMPDIAISMQDDPCKPAWEVGPFFPPGVDRSGSVMAVFDDGRGEALYVAGDLISAGGRQVSLIGRWDGQRWESVEDASGLGLGGGGVAALAVYDDGRGPALYAAGSFDRAGGQFVRGIARWDGAQWEPLEGPLGIGVEGTAQAMHEALMMDGDERRRRAASLRRKVMNADERSWFYDQVKDALAAMNGQAGADKDAGKDADKDADKGGDD